MVKQQRLIIENVKPQINSGQFFIKRVVDEIVNISADISGCFKEKMPPNPQHSS